MIHSCRCTVWFFALALVLGALPAAAQDAAAPAEDPAAVARALFDNADYRAAAEAYTAIVTATPEDGGAWFGLGRARHFLGDWAGALDAYNSALDLGFNPSRVHFHAARAAAAAGDREATLEWLRQLADSGRKPYLAIVNTPEFDRFRDDPEFRAVVARLRPCSGEEYRRFDFWLGDWEVTNLSQPDAAAPPAINRVTSPYDGCTLREEYQAPSGFAGTSLSFYDASTHLWHQTWVDNQGQVLHLNGGLVDGSMVLADPPEAKPMNRITWTPLPEHRVRQLWEVSTDGGETWAIVFNGLYSPAAQAVDER